MEYGLKYVEVFAADSKNCVFQNAEPHDRLQVLGLRVSIHSRQEFVQALLVDFASVTDAAEMSTDRFLVGSDGLTGFLTEIVNELLDVLPLSHPSYQGLMEFFETFCQVLARKISNFKKV